MVTRKVDRKNGDGTATLLIYSKMEEDKMMERDAMAVTVELVQ
jgi:hypothetical protein